MADLTYNPGQGLGWYDTPEDDYICVECGAEDVLFLPHKAGCSEKGDILPRKQSTPRWQQRDLSKDMTNAGK